MPQHSHPDLRAIARQAMLDRDFLVQFPPEAQEQLNAFEEAQILLEECVAHTNGDRALVEYYLTLEQLLLDNGYSTHAEMPTQHSPWYDAMAEVLHRIEHVGTPQEE